MLEQLDLYEVAEAYLSVREPDRPEYERLLIRARADAIPPLLDALLIVASKFKVTSEYKKQIAAQGSHKRLSAKEEAGVRILTATILIKPIIKEAYDVVRRIGPPAQILLCSKLLHYESKIRIAAAILLAMNDSPGKEVQEWILHTLPFIVKKYKKQAILFEVLGVVLFHSGASEWEKIVEDVVRRNNFTIDEWMKRIMNTALAELVK